MEIYHPERSSWLTITHETFDPAEVIRAPQILYPAVIRLTQNPLQTANHLYKGRDYWKPRPGSKATLAIGN